MLYPMSDQQSKSSGAVAISAKHDADREFVLSKLNNDVFVRTGKQIIDACELHIGVESWKSNLADLWEEISRLANQHADRVSETYLIPRSGTVHALFVTKGALFDFVLADALAELNLKLRRSRAMYGDVEASQIPTNELSQFVRDEEIRHALAV